MNPTSHISQALGEDAEELRKKAFLANRMIEKAPAPFDSWFEVDVALQIAGNGFRVVPQYEFADKRIDLVVQGEKSQLAVECDGDFWHGADAYTADMERQRKLERCGWKFFRIRESRYYADPEKALEPLWSLLEQMGILSLTATFKHDTEPEEDNGFDEEDEITKESEASPVSLEEDEEPEEPSQQRELWIDRGISDIPEDIHQAIRVKADVICKAIIQVLEQRPKFSSVRENVPTYILKLWNIRSRGKPREQFAKRVDQQIAIMDRKGYVIIYKSKNERVKLGWVRYQDN